MLQKLESSLREPQSREMIRVCPASFKVKDGRLADMLKAVCIVKEDITCVSRSSESLSMYLRWSRLILPRNVMFIGRR